MIDNLIKDCIQRLLVVSRERCRESNDGRSRSLFQLVRFGLGNHTPRCRLVRIKIGRVASPCRSINLIHGLILRRPFPRLNIPIKITKEFQIPKPQRRRNLSFLVLRKEKSKDDLRRSSRMMSFVYDHTDEISRIVLVQP